MSSEEEVVFNDAGDYIETNLITEDDIKSYRIHVATEEGSKGATLNEALAPTDLAKIILKRKKNKQVAEEATERAKSIEKLKERIAPDKKKKSKKTSRSRSKSPKVKRKYRAKSPARSKSPTKSKSDKKSPKRKSRSRSKSPTKSKSDKKSPKRKSRSRSKSPTKSKSDKKSPKRKSRSRSKSPTKSKSDKKSPKRRSRSRSKSPIKSKSDKKSPKRKSRSRSKSPKRKHRSKSRSKSPKKKHKSKSRSKSPKKRHKSKSRSKSPKKKKKSKSRSRSKSPKMKEKSKSRSRSKSPKKKKKSKSRSKSPKKRKKSKSRSKSPKKKSEKSKSRSKSPGKSSKSKARSKSPSKSSKSRRKSRSRSKSRKRSRSPRKNSRRHGSRSRRRSHSRDRSRRHSPRKRSSRKRLWESRSRSRSRSRSKGRDDYIKKCRSVQDGPDLPVSRPIERRRRRRSRSRSRRRSRSDSVERPQRGLPSSSSYLAIEGPESDKALVTLYPNATPSVAMPTLDRVRLPQQLAQQLFPVSCGSEHKTEEKEKANAPILAIEGPAGEKAEVEEDKTPPSLSEIMQMRIEANKLLVKNPTDSAAKKILHEAQIMMNKWQASTAKNAEGRYTGIAVLKSMDKHVIESNHPLTWARKDMFMNLAPITESPGMALMKKLGWSPGTGLGKEGHGDVNPLQLHVKTDRKGLMNTAEEVVRKRPEDRTQTVGVNWVVKIVNGKHSVSGLGELHQHIGRPCPEYIDSLTPGIIQITAKTAWGAFTPNSMSETKKIAKGKAALWAIKQITVIEAGKYNQTPPEECPTSGVMSVLFVPTKPSSGIANYNANFNNNAAPSIPSVQQSLPPGTPHLMPPAQQRPVQSVPDLSPGMKPSHLMANIARLTNRQQPMNNNVRPMRLPRPGTMGNMPQIRARNLMQLQGNRAGPPRNTFNNGGGNLSHMAALASRIMTNKQGHGPVVPIRTLPEPRVVPLQGCGAQPRVVPLQGCGVQPRVVPLPPRTLEPRVVPLPPRPRTVPPPPSNMDSTPPNEISSWLRTSL